MVAQSAKKSPNLVTLYRNDKFDKLYFFFSNCVHVPITYTKYFMHVNRLNMFALSLNMVMLINYFHTICGGSIRRGYKIFKFVPHFHVTPWRNGSASDSRSEGCVFKSRRGQ